MPQQMDMLVALFNQGHFAEVERIAQEILLKNSKHGFAWKALAAVITLQGRTAESLPPMLKAAQLLPEDAEVHNNLGNTLKNLGRLDEAVACFHRALEMKPELYQALSNLGSALLELGRPLEAMECSRRALEMEPEFAQGLSNLGSALLELGRLDEAKECCLKALKIKPKLYQALNNLGNAHLELGCLDEAKECFLKALEIEPNNAQGLSNLGRAFRELGFLDQALECYQKALEIRPTLYQALNNLGQVLMDLGQLDEAMECYRRALEIRPDYAQALGNRGKVLMELGRLDEARACYRQALNSKPDFAQVRSNLLFSYSYAVCATAVEQLEEATKFGRLQAEKAVHPFSAWPSLPPLGRLRVGVVSGDLHDHPVGFFTAGVFSEIDTSSVELVAYTTNYESYQFASQDGQNFAAVKSLAGLSDQAAASLIYADGVQVLIDLSGHTAHNRLPMFAWKPAPVQVSWLGYWATTGVAAIDYLLVDKIAVPDGFEAQFTEQCWYLPETRLCFTPPEVAPDVSALPAIAFGEGSVTFGCFQLLAKVSTETLLLWGKVFAKFPKASLLWQCRQFSDAALVEATSARLQDLGMAPSRVRLLGSVPRLEYLANYHQVDLVLDTFPFPGGTTTCEALWMGVPTLTLAGKSMLSRQGASLMTAAGLPEWVACSEDDFVTKAIILAGSKQALERLAALRGGLRELLASSPLFSASRFARHLEQALWGMWETWQGQFL
jgi:predicted O-linked N-acetylglucosamine transferase (SPINDLY family)